LAPHWHLARTEGADPTWFDEPVNTFEEELAGWEFADEWRPVVERLAERVADWPATAPDPDDFYVSHPIGLSSVSA
jgi:hypothetical protein